MTKRAFDTSPDGLCDVGHITTDFLVVERSQWRFKMTTVKVTSQSHGPTDRGEIYYIPPLASERCYLTKY